MFLDQKTIEKKKKKQKKLQVENPKRASSNLKKRPSSKKNATKQIDAKQYRNEKHSMSINAGFLKFVETVCVFLDLNFFDSYFNDSLNYLLYLFLN